MYTLTRRRMNFMLAWLTVAIGVMLVTVMIGGIVQNHARRHLAAEGAASAELQGGRTGQQTGAGVDRLGSTAAASSSFIVSVYLSQTGQVVQVPIEQYVAGVVAAEMPAQFELEALQAQAIASRTYIVRRIVEQDHSGMPVADAMVTDTVDNQAYATDAQLKREWVGRYDANKALIDKAVAGTRNLILTYENKPINATFFSTSNGYTENSEDYWGVYLPYLRSVPSPWDELFSPKFQSTVTMPYQQFLDKLGLQGALPAAKPAPATVTAESMQNIQFSQGHRVERMMIAGKWFTGQEIREKLNLSSTAFTWKVRGDQVEIKTKGSGHGVGMSQWGAEGMALEGKSAADILKHYYTGVEIQSDLKYIK